MAIQRFIGIAELKWTAFNCSSKNENIITFFINKLIIFRSSFKQQKIRSRNNHQTNSNCFVTETCLASNISTLYCKNNQFFPFKDYTSSIIISFETVLKMSIATLKFMSVNNCFSADIAGKPGWCVAAFAALFTAGISDTKPIM